MYAHTPSEIRWSFAVPAGDHGQCRSPTWSLPAASATGSTTRHPPGRPPLGLSPWRRHYASGAAGRRVESRGSRCQSRVSATMSGQTRHARDPVCANQRHVSRMPQWGSGPASASTRPASCSSRTTSMTLQRLPVHCTQRASTHRVAKRNLCSGGCDAACAVSTNASSTSSAGRTKPTTPLGPAIPISTLPGSQRALGQVRGLSFAVGSGCGAVPLLLASYLAQRADPDAEPFLAGNTHAEIDFDR